MANDHGIETRLLHEISDDLIREWADKLTVLVTEGRYSLSKIGITLRETEAEEQPKLAQHLQDVLAKSGMDAKIFTQPPDGALVSVGKLLHSAYATSEQELARDFTVTVPPNP